MAAVRLPDDIKLDAPPSTATRLPDEVRLDQQTPTQAPPGPSETVNNVVQSTLTPIINFADYPIRATAADIVGLVKGGIPVNAASREAFNKERAASLEQTALPETQFAKSVEGGIGSVLSTIGKYTPPQMAVRALGLEEAAAPFQTMVGDALGLAGFSRGGAATVKGATERVTDKMASALAKDAPADIEKFIENAYNRAVRPTVVGKGTAAKIEQADQNVLSALQSIVRNKSNLVLADRSGKEVAGRTPHTLDEFVQAIAQTKRPVFDKYDSLARQADQFGVTIDTVPIASELRKFVSDPSFNLPKFQGMRDYAQATANALEAQGSLPPSVAQGMVRNLNEGLTSFYRASSPEAASKAAVDDLVANQLRGRVDSTLAQAGLPGWREARLQYGALKSIENEVAHRAIVYGRQDPGGGLFGRIGTIATYEELARFATSFDPHALIAAGAIRGGRSLTEYLNSPNRAVRRMFDKTEKLMGQSTPINDVPQTGGLQPPRPTGNAMPPSRPGIPRPPGGVSEEIGIQTPAGVVPIERDPFLTPPRGGSVY